MDVQRYLQQIDEGARQVADSAEWRRWLDYQRQFHAYSAGNCWLIMHQCPNASAIAGYVTWQRMGRQVRKGETGIRILAPMIVSARDPQDPERKRMVFHAVPVFDVSQTDGEPIPEPVQRIATAEHGALFERMVAVAEGLGYEVGPDDTGAAGGWVDYGRKRITLNEDAALDQRVKTLMHELGHVLCDHRAQADTESRAQQELEAESVSYCLCAEAGLDTSGYSFAYVTSWASAAKEGLKALKASADTIAKAVKRLWELVEGQAVAEAA